MLKNSIKMAALVVAGILFMTSAAQGARITTMIKGTVVAIDTQSRVLRVKQDSGDMVTLRAPPGIDIKICKVNDVVSVEVDSHNVILAVHVSPK